MTRAPRPAKSVHRFTPTPRSGSAEPGAFRLATDAAAGEHPARAGSKALRRVACQPTGCRESRDGESELRNGQMTPGVLSHFLESQRTLILARVRRDGSPVATPMWFCRVGEFIYCNTAAESAKVGQVRADDRVCAVIEAGEDYFSLRGVRVEGRCRIVVDPDEITRAEEARDAKARRIGSGLEDLPAWFGESRDRRRADATHGRP